MKSNVVCTIGLAVLVALGLSLSLTAQSKPATPLSTADVQQLISRGQPADHARLSAHFTALADRYAAEAKRHASMQPAFAGNAKLANMAASQAAHCKQLAARNQESAGVLRELAAHHGKEAAGAASVPPVGSERFQGVVKVPTDAELTKLAAGAGTPADHSALTGYFSTLAAQYERDAKDSAAYAKSWRGTTKDPSAPAQAAKWERLAKQQSESAAEAKAAAAMHKDHAASAR